jgi:hypothetical protein
MVLGGRLGCRPPYGPPPHPPPGGFSPMPSRACRLAVDLAQFRGAPNRSVGCTARLCPRAGARPLPSAPCVRGLGGYGGAYTLNLGHARAHFFCGTQFWAVFCGFPGIFAERCLKTRNEHSFECFQRLIRMTRKDPEGPARGDAEGPEHARAKKICVAHFSADFRRFLGVFLQYSLLV